MREKERERERELPTKAKTNQTKPGQRPSNKN